MLSSSSLVHACLSSNLGLKGLSSSAKIAQTADVVRRAFLLLFLPCFQLIVRLLLPGETSEMFSHLLKQLVPRSSRLTVLFAEQSTLFFKILPNLVNNSWL